ncbi:unnamed protein product [Zymoseptoria tritici ST99CH_1A5]|uniref:G-protein coupled receptors family 1 profile domain-containing protein n=2 Tax=Zymoseptoria tritici TaxID=1047171 RepID=A0A2H1GYQ1_ZYMTR|nr:unnamed protein product [Zymoseptoria tritici ST99CH_1E4]SMY27927.1 unnamed protein product [Zymoseptoria tritici ST99CH_1A5]
MPSIPLVDSDDGPFQTVGIVVRKAIDLATGTATQHFTQPESQQASGTQQHGLLEARASSLGANPNFSASTILLQRQRYQLQVIAATFSSVSVLAAICALYWFMMMRRNFRRDLVLLLVAGDFWKSSWFLISASTTLAGVDVSTPTQICQASGYFLQMGIESCDLAIFLMSLHMSLQIFPPTRSFLGHDGLYRVRYYVLAAWLIIPGAFVSLAFVNAGHAFIAQGGFCTLPIRPFWYRLALSWIPRYLNWIFIMGVAVRIYSHVGYEFKVFADESDHSSSAGAIPGGSDGTQQTRLPGEGDTTRHSYMEQSDAAGVEKAADQNDSIAPDQRGNIVSAIKKPLRPGMAMLTSRESRRQSVPTFTSVFGSGPTWDDGTTAGQDPTLRPISQSTPTSRRGSKQDNNGGHISTEDFAPPPLWTPQPRNHGSFSTINSNKSSNSYDPGHPAPLPPIKEIKTSTSNSVSGAALSRDNAATRALQLRRKAIQRQLRLLFIYPVMYLILWIMPFISHAFSYSNHFAQHPVYPITVLSIFCHSIMGFVDVCIFCWREKPWRHIPGSDGTFLGSFAFWRFGQDSRYNAAFHQQKSDVPSTSPDVPLTEKDEDSRQLTSSEGLVGYLKRWSKSFSSHSGTTTTTSGSRATTSPDLLGTNATPSPRKSHFPPTPPVVVPLQKRPHRRTHSGRSDRRILEAEHAQERLAIERAEAWRRSALMEPDGRQDGRKGSATSDGQQSLGGGLVQPPPAKKEWWDRHLSLGGQSVFGGDEEESHKS